MLIGAHCPNGDITPTDLAMFKAAALQAAEVLWYHTRVDVANLKAAGATSFLCRLPDSVRPDGTLRGYQEYAAECAAIIARLSPDVLSYQISCEDNILWSGKQINGRPATPWDFAWWLGQAHDELRRLIPGNIRLGMSPLSWSPQYEPLKYLAALRSIHSRFDFLTCHAYWQARRDMTNPNLGGNFTTLHQWFPDKPIAITEWGNSRYEAIRPVPPVALGALQARDYPAWLEWVGSLGYIESSFVFLVGGQGWPAFSLTEQGARAIGRLTRPQHATPQRGPQPV